MEGACGKILDTEDPSIVIKRMYTKASKQRRIKSHRAFMQCRIQQMGCLIMEEASFRILYVPRAFEPTEQQYKMARIDVSDPITPETIPATPEIQKELEVFYELCYRRGLFPCDYELYRQKDGRIAMVDFDKFGEWRLDGTVSFPFGLEITGERARLHTPLGVPLSFVYKN
jgi:hypothetical protein